MRRFDSPRQLMGYLGRVQSKRSTGDTVRRGGITKAGNGTGPPHAGGECLDHRHPPRVGKAKLYRLEQTTPKVREIAWKAQSRLTARYRSLIAKGKKTRLCARRSPANLPGSCGRSPGRSNPPDDRYSSRAHKRRRDHGMEISVKRFGGAPPTPAVRSDQPRTLNRECGNQPAYWSLITDVSQVPPVPVRGYRRHRFALRADNARPER